MESNLQTDNNVYCNVKIDAQYVHFFSYANLTYSELHHGVLFQFHQVIMSFTTRLHVSSDQKYHYQHF